MSEPSYDATLPLHNAIRIPIFVEDEETKVYLENAFPNLLVSHEFISASGACGVLSRIQDYEQKHNKAKAFAIRDRDYGEDDSVNWARPNRRCFALRRHEIENYCIDSKAISAYASERLGQKLAPDEIGAYVRRYANDIVYAVSYNSLVSKLEQRVCRVFKHVSIYPKCNDALGDAEKLKTIISVEDAKDRISDIRFTGLESLEGELTAEISIMNNALSSSDNVWLKLFPGKEILKAIRCRFFASSPCDDSMVRFVAIYQQKNDSVSEDLKSLMSVVVEKSKV